jgi:hypothetical protein
MSPRLSTSRFPMVAGTRCLSGRRRWAPGAWQMPAPVGALADAVIASVLDETRSAASTTGQALDDGDVLPRRYAGSARYSASVTYSPIRCRPR